MAEEQGATGAAEQPGNGSDTAPQVGILSQYVKDMSFENPNAPSVYQWQGQPRIDVEFNIGAQQLSEEVHEVALKIDITARADEGTAFQLELVYAGLFALRNVPADQLQPFLLAEAPRLLFPFARQVAAHAVQDGGFAPLLLDPIDFAALYLQRAAQAGGEGQPAEIAQA